MCKFGKIAVFISFPGLLCSSSLFFLPSFSLPCLFLSSFPHPFFSFFLPSLRPSSLHFPFISLIFPSLSFHYPLLLPFLSLSFHLYSRAVVVVSACCRFCGDYGRCLGFLVFFVCLFCFVFCLFVCPSVTLLNDKVCNFASKALECLFNTECQS